MMHDRASHKKIPYVNAFQPNKTPFNTYNYIFTFFNTIKSIISCFINPQFELFLLCIVIKCS
jgi:hypothetical protein